MFTITEVLDGNIYRVVSDSEIAQAAQKSAEADSTAVSSFDDIYNEAALAASDSGTVSDSAAASDEETVEDASVYQVISYYSDMASQSVDEAEAYDEVAEVSEEDAGTDEQPSDLDSIFATVAASTGVNVNLLKAVAQAESGLDTEAVSSGGALGIMQLMPSVCNSYGVTDPFDATQNITAGAELLSWLMDRYDGDVTLTLAAYNAGYGNVDKYGGVPPFSQTYAFIDKVMGIYGSY